MWMIRLAYATFFWAFLSTSAHADSLKIFGDEIYPPIIHLKNGKPEGILPAVLRRLEAETGDTYELVLQPWKRAYVSAQRGQGAIVGLSDNAERRKLFTYSDVIYDDDIQVVVLKGKEFPFSGLEDLRGKTIGVTREASYGETVDAAIRNGLFKVDEDSGNGTRLKKLLAGRFDAAFVGNGSAGFSLLASQESIYSEQKKQFVVLPRLLARDPLYLGIPKSLDKKALLIRFNKALAKLRKSGELKRIEDAAVMM